MDKSIEYYAKLFPANLQMDANMLAEFYKSYLPNVGVFVEVGAFDGINWSHTSCLAKLGWKGMYIEPYPLYAEACQNNYTEFPNISVVNKACNSFTGKSNLYVKGAVSTMVLNDMAITHGITEKDAFAVDTDTLSNILKAYKYEPFDLLVVDVEGAEMEVLKGFDVAHYRPKLAIIETHDLSGDTYLDEFGVNKVARFCDDYFNHHHYLKIHSDMLNTFYLANDFYKDR